jgi:ubiquinone/menaquinone biosynthesis C-methylase UbiE
MFNWRITWRRFIKRSISLLCGVSVFVNLIILFKRKIMKSIGKGYSTTSAFCYISKVSNEKKIQLREILKNIKDLNKKSYLDVGSGVGDVFLDLSNHFEKSVGVEPGDKMFPILKERAKNKKTIKLYKNTWQSFLKKTKINMT